MSNRKTALLYLVPVVLTSLLVGMVIASRFGLSPTSTAQTIAAPPMNSAPLTGTVSASTFRDIAKNVSPAVVNIRTESRQRTRDLTEFFGGGGGGGGDDLFERFFGQPNPNRGQGGQGGQGQNRQPREQLVQAAGTGFVIDKSGLILTNNHVVEGAQKIVVYLYGEESDAEGYEARIVGRDPLSDSALIELTEKPKDALTGDQVRRLGTDAARRLGGGDRQPVRARPHRQRGRDQRPRAAVPRGQRAIGAGAADRRRDQPRQLGRTAPERPRRGDRDQYGHLHRLAAARQHRHRIRRAEQYRA